VIERRDKRLVLAKQQLTDEPIQGNPRVDDRLTTHAVAGIEQQTETDRNSRIGELRDLLLSAVLENLEVTFHEARDQPAFRVAHRDRHLNDINAGTKGLCFYEGHEGHEEQQVRKPTLADSTPTRRFEHGWNLRDLRILRQLRVPASA
jgi:hypothetical protein